MIIHIYISLENVASIISQERGSIIGFGWYNIYKRPKGDFRKGMRHRHIATYSTSLSPVRSWYRLFLGHCWSPALPSSWLRESSTVTVGFHVILSYPFPQPQVAATVTNLIVLPLIIRHLWSFTSGEHQTLALYE